MTIMSTSEHSTAEASALGWPVSRGTLKDDEQPSTDLGWPA